MLLCCQLDISLPFRVFSVLVCVSVVLSMAVALKSALTLMAVNGDRAMLARSIYSRLSDIGHLDNASSVYAPDLKWF